MPKKEDNDYSVLIYGLAGLAIGALVGGITSGNPIPLAGLFAIFGIGYAWHGGNKESGKAPDVKEDGTK